FIKLKLPIEIAPEKPPKNLTRLRGRHPLSGAVIANMSPALAEELSIDPLTQGVIILEVRMRSPAKRLGLRPGDYLIKVNGKNVDRVITAKRLFQKTQREWALSIRRDGEILSVILR
ncbi:MAG: PDZ domain-containing protein, partial [Rhodospirillales bacterium]